MGGSGVGYKCVGVRAGVVQDGGDIEEMYVFKWLVQTCLTCGSREVFVFEAFVR